MLGCSIDTNNSTKKLNFFFTLFSSAILEFKNFKAREELGSAKIIGYYYTEVLGSTKIRQNWSNGITRFRI